MNFLEQKINFIEEGKKSNSETIKAAEKDIEEKDKEIYRLRILAERLKKIQAVKYFQNLVSPEHVAGLTNQVRLLDFLNSLSDIIQINFTFSTENMYLANLSLWQTLFLLHGNMDVLGPKKPQPTEDNDQAANPGAADPENVSFDPNKKFM